MDYKKWDSLDEDENESVNFNDNRDAMEREEEQVDNDHHGVEIKRLYEIKYNADYLFSLLKYEQSLTLYHQIILELSQRQQSITSSCLASQELYILCHLNLACCYMKIKEWAECVKTCNVMLSSNNTFLPTLATNLSPSSSSDMSQGMSPEKYSRCVYFKAYSLYELSYLESSRVLDINDNNSRSGLLDTALKCCQGIQKIILRTKHFADQSLVSELGPLILRIQKCQEVQQNSIQPTFSDNIPVGPAPSPTTTITSIPASSSSSSSSARDITTLLHESQRSITMNQPLAAIKSLKKCITLMKRRVGDKEDSVVDPRIVSCFQNVGDCYGRLQEYDEVNNTITLWNYGLCTSVSEINQSVTVSKLFTVTCLL